MFRLLRLLTLCGVLLLGYSSMSLANQIPALRCNDKVGYLCTETFDSIGYAGEYTGHDEPSLIFYSNQSLVQVFSILKLR